MAKHLNVNLAFTADTSQAKAQLQDLQRQLTNLATVSSVNKFDLTKDIREATQAAAQLKVQLESATNATTGKLDLSQFNAQLQKSGMSLSDYQAKLSAMGPAGQQAFASVAKSIMQAEVSIRRSNGLLAEMGTTLMNTARWQLSSSILHGFMGTVQKAWGYAKDLNSSLSDIRIVTGQNVDQMAKFADQANRAAKELNTTTTAYTKASLIYYQQGLDDSQVKARTDVTVKMANVANQSAETVSDQMTAVWNNFYDGSKSLEYYADVMTALGAATASSTDEISEGLNKFAAVAETVGLSYEYAASALATITSNTRESADVVGNALKTLFARIQGLKLGETLEDGVDLNKYSEALDTVGIKILDSNGELRRMDDLLNELAAKWDTIGKAEQTALAQTVAGVRQYTQLIALMENWDNGDSDSMVANLETSYGATGTLQEQADIYAESWKAARDSVKASAEDIYDSILDDQFFIKITKGFADFLDIISNTADALGGMKGVITLLGGTLLTAFGPKLAGNIDNFVSKLLFGAKAAEEMKLKTASLMTKNTSAESKDNLSNVSLMDNQKLSTASINSAYEAQGKAQVLMIQNASKLSDQERQIASILLDQNESATQLVSKRADALKIAQQEAVRSKLTMEMATKYAGDEGKSIRARMRAFEDQGAKKMRYSAANSILGSISEDEKNIDLLQTKVKDLKKLLQGHVPADLLDISDDEKDITKLQEKIKQLRNITRENETKANELMTKHGEQIKEAGAAAGIDPKIITDYLASQDLVITKNGELVDANNNVVGSLANIEEFMNRAKTKTYSFGQGLVSLASMITSVTMAFNQLKGVKDIWDNEDLSTGEKIVSTLSSMAMIIPMLVNSFNAENIAKLAGLKIDTAKLKTQLLVNLGKKAEGMETASLTALIWQNVAARIAENWQLALIIAAMALLTAAIIAAAKAYNKEAEEAKKAAEAAEKLNKTAEEAKNKANDLRNAFDEYQSVVDKLNECTKGTQEWKDALVEVHNKVTDIIAKFPELAKIEGFIKSDGTIDLNKFESVLNEANRAEKVTNYAAIMGQNVANQQQYEADRVDVFRSINSSYGYQSVGQMALTNGDDSISGSYTQSTEQYINDINKILLDNIDQLVDESDGTLFRDELMKLFPQENYAGMTDDAYEAFINSLMDYQGILNELAASAEDNAVALENSANLITRQELGEDADNAVVEMTSEVYEKAYNKAYQTRLEEGKSFSRNANKSNNENLVKFWEEYSKATGTNFDLAQDAVTGSKDNRYFHYLDGNETKEISLEQAAAAIATADALKELTGSATKASAALQGINEGDFSEGVSDYIATGSFDNTSQAQVEEMRQLELKDAEGNINENSIKSLFGSVENFQNIAKMMAPEELGEDMAAITDWFITEFSNELKSINFNEIGKGLSKSSQKAYNEVKSNDDSNLDQLSANAQNQIAALFNQVYSEAGKEGLDAIKEVFDNADLDADELKKVQEILSETDWQTTSIEDLTNALEDGGVAAGDMSGPLKKVIDLMKEAAGITLEDSIDQFKTYQDIIEKVKDGKGIEDEVYQTLPDEIKSFFDYTAEGLWALTGDAEAFYNLAQSKSVEGFNQVVADATADNEKIDVMSQNGYYDSIQGAAISDYGYYDPSTHRYTGTDYNQELIQQQIDYLRLSGHDEEAQKYQDAVDSETLTPELITELSNTLSSLGEQIDNLKNRKEENDLKIEKAESAKASSADSVQELNMMPVDDEIREQHFDSVFNKETENKGFDIQEVENFADSLKQANEEQIETEEEAKRLALRLSEMKRGLTTIADNWKNWSEIMKDGDLDDQARVMGEMRKALSDLTGIDMSELPDSFFESAENAKLLGKAAKGDEEAINDLIAAASKEILLKMDLDESAIPEVSSLIDDALAAIDDKNLTIGASLDDTGMYEAFQGMLNAGTVTAEQMTAILKGINFDPQIEMKKIPIDNAVASQDGNTYTVEYLDTEGNVQKKTITAQQYNDAQSVGYIEVPVINSKGTTFTGGGGSINKSTKKKGNGGGGGGGGGGSKKKDPKKASDEIERYHEIKEVISDLERQYDRINKARTRAFGMEAVDLMDQEIQKTEEMIDAQKRYIAEITTNRDADKSALAAYGAKFDDQGRIINYDEIMSQQLAKFNASRTEEAEKAYEEFKKILEQYEETQNLLEEQEAALEDLENRAYDQKLEKVDIEVQLKLSLEDDALKYLEFLLEELENSTYDVAEAFALLGQQAAAYQNQITVAQNGIADILANHGIDLSKTSIEDVIKNGEQLGLTADEIEKLREYRDTMMSSAQALQQLKDTAVSLVTNAFDAWNEKFTTQIELLDHYTSTLESFTNIVDIVGKEALGITDDMLTKWTQATVDNSVNTLKAQRKRVDALRQEEKNLRDQLADIDAQIANATTEEEKARLLAEKEMLEEALGHITAETNAAEEDMMAQWEATLEAAAEAFEQAVETSISAFEKAISGTYGSLDALQTAFDQASEIADRYVDDYREIYELSKLNRDITNSIDNTDNVKAKKALRDLQKEIVELQESDVQMSEYDLKHLRAKYELRLAEIALEEAQNAKSQVRMRKDSEGNYSYVFTADASAVEKAQQDYEDKLYEMQELNSEYIKEMQNNILQSEIELANALRELDRAKFKSDEEYYAEVNRLTQYYTGQRNYFLDEMNKGITNNQETVNEDWRNYSNATGYKMSADKDYIDSFDETIYAQLTGYRSITDAQNQFADATAVMVEDLKLAFQKWQDNVDAAMEAAGTTIADFGQDVNETIYGEDGESGIIGASADVVEEIDSIATSMAEAFGPDAMKAFKSFADSYLESIQPMIDATKELVGDINDLITLEADLTEQEEQQDTQQEDEDQDDETEETTTGSTTTNPYGKPSDLSGNYQNYTERSGVKAIQHALKEMGYDIGSYGIDGKYGSATAAAVRAFQKASGITADGIVGPDTKAKFKAKGYLTGGRVDSTGWAWLDGTPDRPEYVLNADQTDAFIRLVDDLHYMNELSKLADIQERGMYMIDNATKDLIESLSFIDDVMRIIELNAGVQSVGLGTLTTSNKAIGVDPGIQQNITIQAEFPDATDRDEIEAAFDSLFVRASQFANRKI